MKKDSRNIVGIQLLLMKYRQNFRIPENLNHYTKEDLRIAERKYLKWALCEGETDALSYYKGR